MPSSERTFNSRHFSFIEHLYGHICAAVKPASQLEIIVGKRHEASRSTLQLFKVGESTKRRVVIAANQSAIDMKLLVDNKILWYITKQGVVPTSADKRDMVLRGFKSFNQDWQMPVCGTRDTMHVMGLEDCDTCRKNPEPLARIVEDITRLSVACGALILVGLPGTGSLCDLCRFQASCLALNIK